MIVWVIFGFCKNVTRYANCDRIVKRLHAVGVCAPLYAMGAAVSRDKSTGIRPATVEEQALSGWETSTCEVMYRMSACASMSSVLGGADGNVEFTETHRLNMYDLGDKGVGVLSEFCPHGEDAVIRHFIVTGIEVPHGGDTHPQELSMIRVMVEHHIMTRNMSDSRGE